MEVRNKNTGAQANFPGYIKKGKTLVSQQNIDETKNPDKVYQQRK